MTDAGVRGAKSAHYLAVHCDFLSKTGTIGLLAWERVEGMANDAVIPGHVLPLQVGG